MDNIFRYELKAEGNVSIIYAIMLEKVAEIMGNTVNVLSYLYDEEKGCFVFIFSINEKVFEEINDDSILAIDDLYDVFYLVTKYSYFLENMYFYSKIEIYQMIFLLRDYIIQKLLKNEEETINQKEFLELLKQN